MSETKYNSDKSDPQMNISSLDKEFNIDSSINFTTNNTDKALQEVQDMKNELQSLENDIPDADQIILDTIKRANDVLDKVELNITNGDISARLIEVYNQLLTTVIAGATSITGMGYNQQQIDVKQRALDIKEQEIGVKIALGHGTGAKEVNITNNNLTMNREELLKMMEGE